MFNNADSSTNGEQLFFNKIECQLRFPFLRVIMSIIEESNNMIYI
jgi:hypothetical protein